MVNFSEINRSSTTIAKLNSQETEQDLRPYLGASQLGHSCERFLWYSFRWCFRDKHSARLLRLFDRGHREEPAIIKALSEIGLTFWGDQSEVTFAHGHGAGHNDGFCSGVIEAPKTVHLAEFKTMSDKYFKEVCKQGVFVSKPVYYAQSQVYMKEFQLTRCLFVAVNKNDDSMYIERIKYDANYAKDLIRRAEDIILSELPPTKRFEPTWFECKWCSARQICHGSDKPLKTCRTCSHCDILPLGKWSCQQYDDIELSTGQQRLACKNYVMTEGL